VATGAAGHGEGRRQAGNLAGSQPPGADPLHRLYDALVVPIAPQPPEGEVLNAKPPTPMETLLLLFTLHSADSVLLTTGGRKIRLRRIIEPSADQKELLRHLGLSLPGVLRAKPGM